MNEGNSAREALAEAKQYPLDDSVLSKAMREVDVFRRTYPHPSISYACDKVQRELMKARTLKLPHAQRARIEAAEDEFDNALIDLYRIRQHDKSFENGTTEQ